MNPFGCVCVYARVRMVEYRRLWSKHFSTNYNTLIQFLLFIQFLFRSLRLLLLFDFSWFFLIFLLHFVVCERVHFRIMRFSSARLPLCLLISLPLLAFCTIHIFAILFGSKISLWLHYVKWVEPKWRQIEQHILVQRINRSVSDLCIWLMMMIIYYRDLQLASPICAAQFIHSRTMFAYFHHFTLVTWNLSSTTCVLDLFRGNSGGIRILPRSIQNARPDLTSANRTIHLVFAQFRQNEQASGKIWIWTSCKWRHGSFPDSRFLFRALRNEKSRRDSSECRDHAVISHAGGDSQFTNGRSSALPYTTRT